MVEMIPLEPARGLFRAVNGETGFEGSKWKVEVYAAGQVPLHPNQKQFQLVVQGRETGLSKT